LASGGLKSQEERLEISVGRALRREMMAFLADTSPNWKVKIRKGSSGGEIGMFGILAGVGRRSFSTMGEGLFDEPVTMRLLDLQLITRS